MTISFTGLELPPASRVIFRPIYPLLLLDIRSSPSPESGTVPELLVLSLVKFRKRLLMSRVFEHCFAKHLLLPTLVVLVGVIALNSRESQPVNNEDKNTTTKHCIKKNSRGGWGLAFLLLDNASAANNVSKWTGTVYLCSLVGAFLSDSYWGRYLTCALFQVIFVVGLVLLSISSWLFLLKPDGCGDGKQICVPTTSFGTTMFYLAIYLVAFGYGGHQPTIATFGADQFDESIPNQRNSKSAFFCYFYFALNTGSLFSNTILVYYEDSGKWTLGFWVATASAVLALVGYLLGSPKYRYIKACGNPIPRVMQVFVAATRKWKATLGEGEALYEIEGSASAIKGSRKIYHSEDFAFLDKAAMVTERDRNGPPNPWRLCTVTQVEEAKCILRMLPLWLCTIIYSVVFTQMASLFVEQGDVMNSNIGKFHLPAASMSVFDICSVLLCTGIYRQILVPLAGRLSGNPKGLTELHRMGIGLVIAIMAMVAAGVTEMERLKRVIPGQRDSPMSIFWQIPQYVLVGASEVFMYVGQLEFFNGEAPDGIKSLGSALCMMSMSLGNFVSSLLVNMVMEITAKGDKPGWIPENLNEGQMDRFYFLIGALTAVDFVLYMFIDILVTLGFVTFKDEQSMKEAIDAMNGQELDGRSITLLL
ncbi:hypothetical protein DH2020_001105 [Rehmannia glutinosa]|uniref:RRM domain-containing protein n=1 Tax=Rehmannia glutinosa TaxID=99300 RepID=A0ABR0XYE1_REHGL